jgi:serine phosphatase RsbU (regulator of sigma subunit)
LSPAETEELLEPAWADAEERLSAITDETAATVDLLQKQLAALRQAGAEVGTTLDNARLSRLAAQAAATLQRSMLPTRPPRIPGARIAHRYRPGDLEGGGDWFDAIQLPGGRMAFAIGDVMGHGLLSAAVMGQFRTAILTMAVLDLPPAQLLRHLDNLAQRLGTGHLATCLYAVYDPVARTLAVANAGHIPPVLARRYGHSELLQIPGGAPIGVGGVPFETAEVHVPDGSWLVLCSDPLVEMRSQEGYFSLAGASAAAVMEGGSPDAVCNSLLQQFDASSPRNDDLGVLVAHLEGLPPQDVAVWNLAMHPTEARRAREITREQLGRWGLYDLIDTAELLVSELVANALRSNSRHIELRMMRVGKLLIEVADEDFNLPKLQRADPDDEQGRGLSVVSRLSRRWGSSRKAVGKVVWFELPAPTP